MPRAVDFAAAVLEASKTGRMGDAALVYGKYNIAIFPCDPVTKVPIPRRDPDPTGKFKKGIPGTGGVKKATTDPIIIMRWWKENPRALIAVAMGPLSGVWCADVDTAQEHEHESVTAWDALLAQHEPFETREHRSASGGPHVIFEWDDEQPLGCSPGQMPKGISIKGIGGYIIAPPSVRKGKSYTVFRDVNPIRAPQWLIDLITQGKPKPKRDPKNPHPHPPFTGTPQCDLNELAEAMRFVPNDGNLSWEQWNSWALAIFAACGGSQRGFEIFDEWCARYSRYDPVAVDERWYEISGSPPSATGAGKIFAEARRNGWQPKPPAVPPTYAIAANAASEGRDKMRAVVRGFLFAVDNPDPWENYSNAPPPPIAHAACIDVGVGKTMITIEELARWLKNGTARAGPVIYATPRHNLNERIEQQFTAHGINARIFRGREAEDPQHPGQTMCLNLPAVRLAQSCHTEVAPTCCKYEPKGKKKKPLYCHFFEQCGYQRQLRNRDGVEVWIVAIDTLFHVQKALGETITAVIIDEALWQKGVRGVEATEEFDWSVAIDSISNQEPPPKTVENMNSYGLPELDFRHLRYRLANALRAQANNGGVERKYLDAQYLDGTSCNHALGVEWDRFNNSVKELGQYPGMSDHQLQALINNQVARWGVLKLQ
jgi:hypothetical protein